MSGRTSTVGGREIRWPSAAVLITVLACVTLIYVFVPDHRDEILAGCAVVGPIVVAFMRRILGYAAVLMLALAVAVSTPACTPAGKALLERTLLGAAELLIKFGGKAIEDATSGGEE